MLNVIKNQRPTHLAVAWDLTKEFTFRKKLFSEYKGHRKNLRPELGNQFPLAQEVLKKMGIPEFVFEEYEADDIIGTLARKFEDDIRITICLKIKTFCSLLMKMSEYGLLLQSALICMQILI
jgi:DNA polymerase-1